VKRNPTWKSLSELVQKFAARHLAYGFFLKSSIQENGLLQQLNYIFNRLQEVMFDE
jgi:hypothetical protein